MINHSSIAVFSKTPDSESFIHLLKPYSQKTELHLIIIKSYQLDAALKPFVMKYKLNSDSYENENDIELLRYKTKRFKFNKIDWNALYQNEAFWLNYVKGVEIPGGMTYSSSIPAEQFFSKYVTLTNYLEANRYLVPDAFIDALGKMHIDNTPNTQKQIMERVYEWLDYVSDNNNRELYISFVACEIERK